MKILKASRRLKEYLLISFAFLVISIFFFLGLLLNGGDVAQQDLGIPLTANAALNDASSLLHIWSYNGFGGVTRLWGYPSVSFITALLAPFGFFGGTEIKILSVFLIALAGITMYSLARSFRLRSFSSFLSGLLFMTTAVLFDWLMFGWIYYLIGYALLPLMILVIKRFLETNDKKLIIANALIFVFGLQQPTYVLVYPLLAFLFVVFESKLNLRLILKGVLFIFYSSMLYILTALGFFLTLNSSSFTFYYGNYFVILQAQFQYLSPILNPIRLWGSTFAYQFETYFPKELIFFSFIPIVLASISLLLKSRDRRVIFFTICYMFFFIAYEVYANFKFFVFNVPYGAVFEAPNIFLAPAALGLAFLVGSTHDSLQRIIHLRLPNKKSIKILCSVVILVFLVLAGFPWWSGQTTGTTNIGPSTKLNLYEMPEEYTQWSDGIRFDNEFFVLYVTSEMGRAQILNSSYFSHMYQGVNGALFTDVNSLPYISSLNSTAMINELVNGTEDVSAQWGNYSIKYIVLYKNVDTGYNNTDIINRLSNQSGLVEFFNSENVIVFKNNDAKPVVHSDNSCASIIITYHDPTMYKVDVNSTSPYKLTLNQAFSSGWTVSVNGVALSDSEHFIDSNGFNCWSINESGKMAITIYYKPQSIFIVGFIISTGVLIAMIAVLIYSLLKKCRSELFYINS
jgi:hypothetical protein